MLTPYVCYIFQDNLDSVEASQIRKGFAVSFLWQILDYTDECVRTSVPRAYREIKKVGVGEPRYLIQRLSL